MASAPSTAPSAPTPAVPAVQGIAPVAPGSANLGQHASGSLYVGDITPDVTEAVLFETFNRVGPVSSIRVCRDAATRRSLGYAYVNFHSVVDAERALDTLNFTPIKGAPCRIMWSHRDPSIRKNCRGNIFIKNLDATIDNKSLYDTFSEFGNILSCKIATDGSGASKGFGFVHFENEESALKAIDKVNNAYLAGKKVYVGKFERRTDRLNSGSRKFTNVYVKHIPTEWDEEKFRQTFERFGTITSLVLRKDESNKHLGFGFVNYESHEQAEAAVEQGCKIVVAEDKCLFVDRFQKKAERQAILNKKVDEKRRERMERFRNLNLYVKNLDEEIDDGKLKELFQPFGEMTSVIVMKDDNGHTRGFGFVCFTNPEDATKALNEMNGKMIGSRPLYVNRAQRKDERRAQMEGMFHSSGQRMPHMAQVFFAPQPGIPMQHMMMSQYRRFPQPGAMMRMPPMYPQAQPGRGRGRGAGGPGRGPVMPPNARGGAANAGKFRQGGPGRYPRDPRDLREQVPMQAPIVSAPQNFVSPDLTTSALASQPPEMQRQLLGERLFPMIHKEQPQLAGKITGMLLEMEVPDILGLLESPEDLKGKIQEALEVLGTADSA